jgi:uncharacterized protein (DUF2384 family)
MARKIRRVGDFAYDAVKVLNDARKVSGNSASVNVWLNSPEVELGGEVPAALLFSAEGAVLVLQELARLKANRQPKE